MTESLLQSVDLAEAAPDTAAAPAEHSTSATEMAAAALTPPDPGQPEAWLDRVLDARYRVLRVLGEGGMGAVFVAEHLRLHKLVALKIVRAGLSAGTSEVSVRLAREAMATARLEHPHVASAIDYGSLPEGGTYFVMQLVRGTSLRRLLTSGRRLPWPRACEIAAQVADALSATRAAGITHRDLKPDNILVEIREDGSDLVKVLDFGIAQLAPRPSMIPGGETERQITATGTVMGTPGYMAPEQAVGDRVDHRADLYSLGVVLWEAIAGRELWTGPDLTTLVSKQMSERVPLLRDLQLDPTLPPQLDELIQALTERLPSARPEHPAQVRDGLRRIARAYPIATSALSTPANAQLSSAMGGGAGEPTDAERANPSSPSARAAASGRRGVAHGRGPRRSRPGSSQIGLKFWFAALVVAAIYLAARTFFGPLRPQASASQPERSRRAATSAPVQSVAAPPSSAQGAAFCPFPVPPSTFPSTDFSAEVPSCDATAASDRAVESIAPASIAVAPATSVVAESSAPEANSVLPRPSAPNAPSHEAAEDVPALSPPS